MGTYTFRLPDIGEGIAEAEIVAWHVKIGDTVEEDGKLADLMTDKATVEMESPVSGVVREVAGDVGDVIAIGSPLVVIETEGGEVDAPAPKADVAEERIEAETPEAEDVDEAIEEAQQVEEATPPPVSPEPVEGPPAVSKEKNGVSTGAARTVAKVLASPAVRQRAKDLGIDLADVRSADGTRVRHADLDAFLSYGASKGYAPAGKPMRDETIKVIGLRKRIAENMAASKRAIPHFTYVEEIDVTELEKLRADLNDNRGSRPKVTLLPLFIAALCKALPQYPMLNARYDDEANVISRSGAVHIGMATQTDAGLMVPVIRDAQGKNLWQLASDILRLADAARSGKAKSEELSGSTITVTSLGPLGGIASTPVINRPEVAIVGPNRIVERPMFVSDGMGGERVEKRKLMNVSISCDHRVVDGHDAASFVQAIKKLLETPVLLLAD
ncbi:MAG TPA: dihydrolipoamide acetyltransferase family protein [Croceibacterium sp.]|nr:dihydrolipoamide acetyltransferase family protein [Croceibacterium sp.]